MIDHHSYLNNFVEGMFVNQSGGTTISVLSPHNNRNIGKFRVSDSRDVELAVRSAERAFSDFSMTSFTTRSKLLMAIAVKIRENLEKITYLESFNTGKVLFETRADVLSAAECFEYYSACALTFDHKYTPVDDTSYILTIREPLGVCSGLGAWNFPFANIAWKVAPAICMGNTFVYKPSILTPITSCLFAEICYEAGLPAGVVNVVQGDGSTGELLCKHEAISKISFTGHSNTGKIIASLCSDTFKHVSMELGGKSPLVIFEDAILNEAVKGAILANFTIQGQVCSNAARVYVHESIYKNFKKALVEATKAIKVGNPFDSQSQSGAMISKKHLNKVLGFIDRACSQGAEILCGGEKLVMDDEHLSEGCYMSPCILERCTDDMEISKEEVFGPVMCLYTFKTEEEVIQRSNSTVYGLAAGVYTQNIGRVHRMTKALNVGTVYVNTYNIYHVQLPLGGRKHSGYGRENGKEVLDHFSEVKSVLVQTGATPEPFT